MYEVLKQHFHQVIPNVDFCSLRLVETHLESLQIRKDILEPPFKSKNMGVMITVVDRGGLGYAATSDLSLSGLQQAAQRAWYWAQQTQGKMVFDCSQINFPSPQGNYPSFVQQPWDSESLSSKLDRVRTEAKQCPIDDKIVHWQVSLKGIQVQQLYLTSAGGELYQSHDYLVPIIKVLANQGVNTQIRTLGGHGYARQGGLEQLELIGFSGKGRELAEESLQLLSAPNCPTGRMDVLLAPDQMILQVHESIGHPLELDRILGDERNYAGTSFVTLDMFGTYQYGSELLNVTYDPSIPEELSSYHFDDEGLLAEKTYLIRQGLLKVPLGGLISQARAGLPGVANSRATNWNRPPIDRMANLNVEPGESCWEDLVGSIEHGVLMRSNKSWSIDDSRNKFQFGCEWGQLIEKGQLSTVVKNPNYRGISATFWRSLKGVGNVSTHEVLGVTNCGKGEPNQAVRVGHASPACVFAGVDVFGGV